MCDCHAKIDAKLAPLNGKLATAFTFKERGSGKRSSAGLTLLMWVEKIAPRGKKPPHVMPTFCPFCGKKTGDTSETA